MKQNWRENKIKIIKKQHNYLLYILSHSASFDVEENIIKFQHRQIPKFNCVQIISVADVSLAKILEDRFQSPSSNSPANSFFNKMKQGT